ncbi:hypothetical protein [Bacillus cabrialesii]|uniref:hypothetical protein n=1 Tax=Bacillus cabrialesii TaxID=2487276 RepID=UPI00387E7BE8
MIRQEGWFYEEIHNYTYYSSYNNTWRNIHETPICPMGGINAEGYLNGNKEKEFWGIYDKSNDTITSSYVDAKEKPECEDKPCED